MIKKGRTSVYDCQCYIVWTTKYLERIFCDTKRFDTMRGLLSEIEEKNDFKLKKIEIYDNYIKLQVDFPPRIAVTDIVKSLKGKTGKEWFKHYPEDRGKLHNGKLWSGKFFATTSPFLDLNKVHAFIESEPREYNGGRKRKDVQ